MYLPETMTVCVASLAEQPKFQVSTGRQTAEEKDSLFLLFPILMRG